MITSSRSLPIGLSFGFVFACYLALLAPAAAQSWLQWGGPTRDFHIAANGLH